MPESMLERFNARQAERAALIEGFIKVARDRAVAFGKSGSCLGGRCELCTGTAPHREGAECLCPCHDPATTYWAWWSTLGEDREIVGLTSGPYGSVGEAIDDGFAGSGNDGPYIREHESGKITQVTEAQWDALMDWDAKTQAERDELRAATPVGAGR